MSMVTFQAVLPLAWYSAIRFAMLTTIGAMAETSSATVKSVDATQSRVT